MPPLQPQAPRQPRVPILQRITVTVKDGKHHCEPTHPELHRGDMVLWLASGDLGVRFPDGTPFDGIGPFPENHAVPITIDLPTGEKETFKQEIKLNGVILPSEGDLIVIGG
jgi:hypothetical protein